MLLWGYLRTFCSMAHRMGLSSGANPLAWRRSRQPHGSGRAIKNALKMAKRVKKG